MTPDEKQDVLSMTEPQDNGEPVKARPEVPNPLFADRYRLENQNYREATGVKKILTVVPARKPNRHEWIRVRPGAGLNTAIFEDKLSRDHYLVDPGLWPELGDEVFHVSLLQAITRQGDTFIWPIRLPDEDGRSNRWNDSAMEAAQRAEDNWVRVASNQAAGYYNVFEASAKMPDPTWPDETFDQLLAIAFRGKEIASADHPIVVKLLRGGV